MYKSMIVKLTSLLICLLCSSCTFPVVRPFEQRNGRTTPSLHEAVRVNDMSTVKGLLAGSAPVNSKNLSGHTPLHIAAYFGWQDVAEVLLAHGADVHTTADGGWTPLHFASQGGHTAVVRLLLVKGARVDAMAEPGLTSLYLAAMRNYPDTVVVLLAEGANVNAKDDSDRTLLHRAAEAGHYQAVKILLEYRADMSARDWRGWTPLHVVASGGYTRLADLLLQRGSEVNAATRDGTLPLKLAIITGHEQLANLLRSHGAKLAHDLMIDIGSQQYRLSEEAQQYLTVSERSTYDKTRSILIINEPHYNVTAQWYLYKGLEAFFRDNPRLPSETIFLAEGGEVGQPISVAPLVKVVPNPDELLIQRVLQSFLIPGYLAYEWKYQRGIPTVGTEDPQLYKLSTALWAHGALQKLAVWHLSVIARNKTMVRILMDKIGRYANPILFAGGKHLRTLEHEVYTRALQEAAQILTEDQLQRIKASDNVGIAAYLQQARIGYTFISSNVPQPLEVVEKSMDAYRKLFQAQEGGDYAEYIRAVVPGVLGK
jgi:ankyrin repeat protein